ncbi:MAG: sulfatase [Acidobacteriota bacterium]
MRAAMPRRLRAALALAALPCLLAGCPGRTPRGSVLLITVDTLRADHLGCYGYARPTSPNMDRLAADGVLFERVYASVPRTTQSIASILTGRYPNGHGARGLISSLSDTNLTLAEILSREGYATAAFVSNMFLSPGQGFGQGFDIYDNPIGRWEGNSASRITLEALEWLGRLDPKAPFFLWVHYLDPHWTYDPSPPFDSAFDVGRGEPLTLYEDVRAGRLSRGQVIFENRLSRRQVARVVALYDGEIAQVDAALAPLIERTRGRDPPVLIVLTSDHGESLGEHDYYFAHGEYLYQPGLHIPLIITYPGRVPAGLRSAALAQNVDIAPTVLSLLGIDALHAADGRPLLVRERRSRPTGGAPAEAAPRFVPSPGRSIVFAESDFQLIHPENKRYHVPGPRGRWSSASDGRYKLIHIPTRPGELLELYDLRDDPAESIDLQGRLEAREVRSRLLRELKRFVDYDPGIGIREPGSMAADELDRLRSLGYLN